MRKVIRHKSIGNSLDMSVIDKHYSSMIAPRIDTNPGKTLCIFGLVNGIDTAVIYDSNIDTVIYCLADEVRKTYKNWQGRK